MTLRLKDKWVWDFWFARDGDSYHIFYLQAPRSLIDAKLRHKCASIGHAVSKDLTHWEVLPDALMPEREQSAWDSCAIWTGSIIRYQKKWFMFYTGISRLEDGLIQRIGLAISDDLIDWQRYPENPIMEVDSRWYELLDRDIWHEQVWRDPWVFEYNGAFHAFITARVKTGKADSRGVIGYASSTDLKNWEIKAPITEAGEFGDMEVPQLVQIKKTLVSLFQRRD